MFRFVVRRLAALTGVLALSLAWCNFAAAQATRTWVSGVGDDANPCSRTAPCKTFQSTLAKTAAGGTITVLDPGAYGTVTITKAITIEAVGDPASVLHPNQNGIVVSAGANDTVTIRGLALDGNGNGVDAVRFISGRTLVLERVTIANTAQNGVDFAPSAAASLVMRDVTIARARLAGTTVAGIRVAPLSDGSAAIEIEDVRVVDSPAGIVVSGPTSGTVRDSSVTSSTTDCVSVVSDGRAVDVLLDNVTIGDCGSGGLASSGASAVARLSRSAITGSGQGVIAADGGRVVSFGDNRIAGNVVNGTPTETQGLQ